MHVCYSLRALISLRKQHLVEYSLRFTVSPVPLSSSSAKPPCPSDHHTVFHNLHDLCIICLAFSSYFFLFLSPLILLSSLFPFNLYLPFLPSSLFFFSSSLSSRSSYNILILPELPLQIPPFLSASTKPSLLRYRGCSILQNNFHSSPSKANNGRVVYRDLITLRDTVTRVIKGINHDKKVMISLTQSITINCQPFVCVRQGPFVLKRGMNFN